jgi:hypothetical protein
MGRVTVLIWEFHMVINHHLKEIKLSQLNLLGGRICQLCRCNARYFRPGFLRRLALSKGELTLVIVGCFFKFDLFLGFLLTVLVFGVARVNTVHFVLFNPTYFTAV